MNYKRSVFKSDKKYYFVEKTRIYVSYTIPAVGQEAYTTRNAAIRAVSRYRRENLDYEYSHPDNFFKNFKKLTEKALDAVFNDTVWDKYKANHELIVGPQTIKIKKFNVKGISYKRS